MATRVQNVQNLKMAQKMAFFRCFMLIREKKEKVLKERKKLKMRHSERERKGPERGDSAERERVENESALRQD